MRDRYLQVINLGIYPLTQWFSKNETLKELARESLFLCQFFHENLWCYKGFEIMGTDGSLILKFSKELTESEPKVL
jgi:hypothetical protein